MDFFCEWLEELWSQDVMRTRIANHQLKVTYTLLNLELKQKLYPTKSCIAIPAVEQGEVGMTKLIISLH